MSKIKRLDDFDRHTKSKARRELRRSESEKIRKNRIRSASNNIYGYPRGYWIRNDKWVGERYTTKVPGQYYDKKVRIGDDIRQIIYINQRGEECTMDDVFPIYKWDTVFVGEHEVIKTRHKLVELKAPVLKRIWIAKSWYKKQAAKAARRARGLSNGSMYKKVYDMYNTLW